MSKLKFFTDAHIAQAIVDQLRQRGVDTLRCQDVGLRTADDSALLEYAAQNGYVLLSMDRDVTRLHTEWVQAGKSHGGIFYAPMRQFQGQQGIGPIVRDCAEWAELIEGGAGTLEEDVHNRLRYIEK